ncbi:hypothetical protein BGZ95_000701 [Linnemannia exigua]|uniref:NACHT domain-containing protein n=1 Tax=Linnemannia exigua TaxID=604196 RepID=A0AAD4H460_9FUNG|nr:hypothetical protein BGZ95_000701 [Linnemannia exigua]
MADNPRNSSRVLGEEMTSRRKSAVTTIKTATQKFLRPSSKDNHSLPNGVAAIHFETCKILNRVSGFVKDELSAYDSPAAPVEEVVVGLIVQEAPDLATISSTTTTSSSDTGEGTFALARSVSLQSSTQKPRQVITLRNVGKPMFRTSLPEFGRRFSSTLQLAYSHRLLPKKSSSPPPIAGLVIEADDDVPEMEFDVDEEAWMTAIGKDSIEQGRVCWLTAQVVAEFHKVTHRDVTAIEEVVLLGAVLERKDYRSVLSCLIGQLEREILLECGLLQGLVQLLQDASQGYLIDDDLIRILRVLRRRLRDTYMALGEEEHAASDHIYHLVTAVSRVLDAMMDGNVKGLNRTEDHTPLLVILAEMKHSSDPYLKFQATYAWQALQFVGNDESPLQAALRFGGGVAMTTLSVASVFKFDVDHLLNGLHELGLAAGQAYDVAKSGVEGAKAFRDGGEGVIDSMLKGFRSGHKRAWYPALQGARVCIREGRLAKLQRVVYEAPCRREREFQLGICQLLGELALDPIWESNIREQIVDFLGVLYEDDEQWGSDADVKNTINVILCYIVKHAEQIIQHRAVIVMQGLTFSGAGSLPRLYPLTARLPHPPTSLLLSKVPRLPSIEYGLHRMMEQRRQEHRETVYIPPLAKEIRPTSIYNAKDGSEEETEVEPFLLMDRVMEFLSSEQQVFLILGDSGSGKSIFNTHLESVLLKAYKFGGSIPLYIHLPDLENPLKELIPEHLGSFDFSEEDIRELKQDREFIIICDGYDEKQLSENLHKSNMLNRRWSTKMIISCRTSYVAPDYQRLFQPQPINHHDPPTFHLFQEVAIVPFSPNQINRYVEQFVQETEVHKWFGGRAVWSAELYMEKLAQVPGVMSLAKNPFLLILSLRALPKILAGVFDVKTIGVTRKELYETFVKQWLEAYKTRLFSTKFDAQKRATLEELSEDFTATAIDFLKNLALNIVQRQQGNYVVRYKHTDDKGTWKVEYFGPHPKVSLLREASPLTKTGHLHRFIHHSLLEYFCGFERQDIYRLKMLRLREHDVFQQSVYITPLAKPTLESSDRDVFPLMDKVKEFLQSDRNVLLLLADLGVGKTSFLRHLERTLWEDYKEGDSIPLFVSLVDSEDPTTDLIPQQLERYNFSPDVIQEMKQHQHFILICDGYDEAQLKCDLSSINRFNCPGHWSAKVIITCRTGYLGLNSINNDDLSPPVDSLFQQASIVPFSENQIEEYIEEYVHTANLFSEAGTSVWSAKEFWDTLSRIPNLVDLAKNPILHELILKVLPTVATNDADFSSVDGSQYRRIFDTIVGHWVESSRRRLLHMRMSTRVQVAFEILKKDDFNLHVIEYQKSLANAIFSEQGGNPVVEYLHHRDYNSWKAPFFGPDPKTILLRDASMLQKSGINYSFIHRSLLEYFYMLYIYDHVLNYDDNSSEEDEF